MQKETRKLSVNQVVKKLVPTSEGQVRINEPQLKRPYGRFVNKCTYYIHHESCKVLRLEYEEGGKRHAECFRYSLMHLCFAENKN